MNPEQAQQPWRPEPKVVGGTPEEQRQAVEELLRIFREQSPEKLNEKIRKAVGRLEYEKRPEEVAAIAFANQKTNELIARYGGSVYEYPEQNIHIVPSEVYRGWIGRGGFAVARQNEQIVVLNAAEVRQSKFTTYTSVLEELLHLKSFLSLQTRNDAKKFVLRRSGLQVRSTVKDIREDRVHQHFNGLEEAVTGELVKRLYPEILAQPDLADDKQWLSSVEYAAHRARIAAEEKILPEDLEWVSRDGKDWVKMGYCEVRRVLAYIIQELAKDHPEMSKDEILELFVRAKLSGNLKPMARAIRESFGKHGLRVIAMMETDYDSAENAFEFLRVLRTEAVAEKRKKK